MHSHPQFGVVWCPLLNDPSSTWAVSGWSSFLCSHMVKGGLKAYPTGTHWSSSTWNSFSPGRKGDSSKGTSAPYALLGLLWSIPSSAKKGLLWSLIHLTLFWHSISDLFIFSQLLLTDCARSITSKCQHCDLGMVGYHQKVWAHCLAFLMGFFAS